MTKFEGNLVYLYANYLFIKCERVEFKKTGCRLIFLIFFFFNISKIKFRQNLSEIQKNNLNYQQFGYQSLPNENEINQCDDGYKGLLCSSCDRENGYYKAGLIVCKKCPDYFELKFLFRTLVNLIWFFLFRLY